MTHEEQKAKFAEMIAENATLGILLAGPARARCSAVSTHLQMLDEFAGFMNKAVVGKTAADMPISITFSEEMLTAYNDAVGSARLMAEVFKQAQDMENHHASAEHRCEMMN